MPDAMSASLNRATFALQSRLFVAMKRAGRVIDLIWLQHNVEYARAVLDTAECTGDEEVREIARRLRSLLGDYLLQGQARISAPRPVAGPAQALTTSEPAAPAPVTAPVTAPSVPVAPAVPAAADSAAIVPAAPPAAVAAELDRHLTSLR